jgi:sulfate/thiosulfate transport system substrate-binding protein
MRTLWLNTFALIAVLASATLVTVRNFDGDKSLALLNVSYDPTRELYQDINEQFTATYTKQTGHRLTIKQSHGGSSRQAREVIDGLDADVVTLALPSDVESLHKHGLIADGWADRLPNHSVPYTSTIVFVVRKGNPKGIHDWPDLVQSGVGIVTPNPKTSGNGKLSVLAAWGSVICRGGSDSQAALLLKQILSHIVMLGEGARNATNSFAQDEVGDVHLTWENEALLETADSGGKLEIVYPPVSIQAQPTVAWVDANVCRHGSEERSRAYLQFLFSDEVQEIIARHGYRPINEEVLARHRDQLPAVHLFPITLLGRDWEDVEQRFFADNGIYDVAIDSPGNIATTSPTASSVAHLQGD